MPDQPQLSTTGPEGIDWAALRKGATVALIVFYLYSMSIWLAPKSLWRTNLRFPVERAALFLGLGQDFITFAPEPEKTDVNMSAVITYDDGSKSVWQYPRAETYQGYSRMVKDKYRRFLHSYLRSKQMLPNLALFIARQSDSGPHHPASIQLITHTKRLVLPGGPEALPVVDAVVYDAPLPPSLTD